MPDVSKMIEDIMESSGDKEELNQVGASLLPFGVPVLSIEEISRKIAAEIDQVTADEFVKLAVFGKIPDDPKKLRAFLKDKTDVISMRASQRLGDE